MPPDCGWFLTLQSPASDIWSASEIGRNAGKKGKFSVFLRPSSESLPHPRTSAQIRMGIARSNCRMRFSQPPPTFLEAPPQPGSVLNSYFFLSGHRRPAARRFRSAGRQNDPQLTHAELFGIRAQRGQGNPRDGQPVPQCFPIKHVSRLSRAFP